MTAIADPTIDDWIAALKTIGACSLAVDWLREQESCEQAWATCKRGDDMLWLLGRLSGEPGSVARRKLVLCACECARLATPYWPKDSSAIATCLELAERWGRGDESVSPKILRAAADAAGAAGAAADAAADAADAADAAAGAAGAAYAAYAAAGAADAAGAAGAAGAGILKTAADIVRKHYPEPPALEKP